MLHAIVYLCYNNLYTFINSSLKMFFFPLRMEIIKKDQIFWHGKSSNFGSSTPSPTETREVYVLAG